MFDEVVAREVLEEFAAVPGAVVRVGAEAEVEEGKVRDAVVSLLVSIDFSHILILSRRKPNATFKRQGRKLTPAPQQKAA